MSAIVNRTSVGDGANNRLGSGSARSISTSAVNNDSPLQVFVRAKKRINDIFGEIFTYTKDAVIFLQSINDKTIIEDEELQLAVSYVDKVKAIKDVLSRDHMKVAFFGRTSNGKSTVINAMLHEKILPSGIGHTTNCFLQVEGSENNEAYLMTENSDEKFSVESVSQLVHALCDSRLQECELVHIFWPTEKCALLRDDVVFVDSPGVDVTPNLDQWIDNHCLDADVFVLVVNAESTLMITEKNFFHKVSTKLSKPNLFILNNRWDASASEPEFLDQVRSQHATRCADFLVNELKVYTAKEAEERIFFISAKEALLARLKEKEQKPASSAALAEGFQSRYFEFQDFERKFQECISKSAVKTKFEQHSQRGRTVTTDIKAVLENVHDKSNTLRTNKLEEKKKLHEQMNYTEQQLMMITREMKYKIRQMVEDVEQKVSWALKEEIRRLSNLVDEFSVPFHSDQLVLNIYKKELHAYVEKGLGSNLRSRLSAAVALNIEASQQEMTDRLLDLVPEEKRAACNTSVTTRREPFQVYYRLNCENLCTDFHEDLQFRFTWGLSAVIQRFQKRLTLPNCAQRVPRPITSPTESLDSAVVPYTSTENNSTFIGPLSAEQWGTVSKLALASYTSQGTMGGLLVAGFLLKTIGWRAVAIICTLYGALYSYERITWTSKAKEKVFKKQYVDHITRKLKLIVDLTSSNCSHQVQQELSTTFAQLCHIVDEASGEMDTKLRELDAESKMLEVAATSAKKLRNKATYLNNELDMFNEAFIKAN